MKVLGWKFCVKTIYAVFMLTFLLGMSQEVMRYMGQVHPESFAYINPAAACRRWCRTTSSSPASSERPSRA